MLNFEILTIDTGQSAACITDKQNIQVSTVAFSKLYDITMNINTPAQTPSICVNKLDCLVAKSHCDVGVVSVRNVIDIFTITQINPLVNVSRAHIDIY